MWFINVTRSCVLNIGLRYIKFGGSISEKREEGKDSDAEEKNWKTLQQKILCTRMVPCF